MQHFVHFAYLDPNTGSLLIQSLIGVSAGLALFGRRMIGGVGRKARSLFASKKDVADRE